MLYITSKDSSSPIHQIQWHIKEKLQLPQKQIYNIIEVQADGDELSFILRNITNLTRSLSKVQRWYGDDAKFIASFLLIG